MNSSQNKILYGILRQLMICSAVLLFSFGVSVRAEGQYYRYVNEQGIQKISRIIPPEYVRKGYDIVTLDGVLLRRVPRELSEEELQLRNTDEARAQYKEEEAMRMRAWDQSLMLRYSSVEDIDAAEQRAMGALKVRISILNSNLNAIKAQIEREQLKAADIERSGNKVPDVMNKNIEMRRLEIEDTEQSIALRREEIRAASDSYQRDRARFATLQERVALRRQQYRSGKKPASKSRYSGAP